MILETIDDLMTVPTGREIDFLMIVRTDWILTFCYRLEIDRVIIRCTILEIKRHGRTTAPADQMMEDIQELVEPSSDPEE